MNTDKYTICFVVYILCSIYYIYNKKEHFIAPKPGSTSSPSPIVAPAPAPTPSPAYGPSPANQYVPDSTYYKSLKYNLSVMCIIKNDDKVLDEFFKHYKWQGIDHFYIIDSANNENSKILLTPYVVNNTLTYYNISNPDFFNDSIDKDKEYNKIYENVQNETRWLIVCDIDEYIYNRTKEFTILDYLCKLSYDSVAGVELDCKSFGSSGIVIQDDTMRVDFIWRDKHIYSSYKSIINTSLTTKVGEYKNEYKPDTTIVAGSPYITMNKYLYIIKENYLYKNILRYGTLRDDAFFTNNKNEINDEELKKLVLTHSTDKGAIGAYGRPSANFVVL
jgi:hypothetical protein